MKGKGLAVTMDFAWGALNAGLGIASLGSAPIWTTALGFTVAGACLGFGLFLIFVER